MKNGMNWKNISNPDQTPTSTFAFRLSKSLLPAMLFAATVIFGSSNLVGQCGDPACSTCVTTAPAPTVVASNCGQCEKASCSQCRLRSLRRSKTDCNQCPKCEGDICKLELDNGKVKKTCFKTEQKAVCVPAVRLPWMKSCPPGSSKTRLVTKLSKHTYECPKCSYKWTLQKPEEAESGMAPTPAQPQVFESTPVYDSYLPGSSTIEPTEPNIDSYTPPVEIMPQPMVTPMAVPTSPAIIPNVPTINVPTTIIPNSPSIIIPNATPTNVPAMPSTVPPASTIPANGTSGGTSFFLTPWRASANTTAQPTVGRR